MNYHYTYTYTDPHPLMNGTATAVAVGIAFLVFGFILLLSYIVCAFLLSRIFQKAGVPQWAAWVPIYNLWKLLELGGQFGFWSILTLIPFANFVAWIFLLIASYNVSKKLGKDDWFVLLAVFLPLVWLIWLAFDDSKWLSAKKAVAKPAASRKKPATRKKSA